MKTWDPLAGMTVVPRPPHPFQGPSGHRCGWFARSAGAGVGLVASAVSL